MKMEAKVFRLKLPMRNTFRIAHGSYTYRENLFLALGCEGVTCMGEAPVVPYYGVSADEIEADLRAGVTQVLIEASLSGPVTAALADKAFAYPVSRSAFQAAIVALKARLEEKSQTDVLGIGEEERLPAELRAFGATTYTVAYDDDPEAMAGIAASCGFERLKVKAGIPGDVERISLIRERLPGAIIRVDANQGWSAEEAADKIAQLEKLRVELIEEPTAGGPGEFERLAAATSVPILLDESARDAEAVRRYAKEAPSVAGIVVKAAKNGGPASSLGLIRAAREAGMDAMLSCMVETSLGVGAVLPLAPLCRWCDLDAPLLIAEDPFQGLSYAGEAPVLGPEGVMPGPEATALVESLPSFI